VSGPQDAASIRKVRAKQERKDRDDETRDLALQPHFSTSLTSDSGVTEGKGKRRKKGGSGGPEGVLSSSEGKRAKEGRIQQPTNGEMAGTSAEGIQMKRKRRKERTDDIKMEPKKKRKIARSGFVNPQDDASLTDQARKGMSVYILSRFVYDISRRHSYL
jgi:hypothetical protein